MALNQHFPLLRGESLRQRPLRLHRRQASSTNNFGDDEVSSLMCLISFGSFDLWSYLGQKKRKNRQPLDLRCAKVPQVKNAEENSGRRQKWSSMQNLNLSRIHWWLNQEVSLAFLPPLQERAADVVLLPVVHVSIAVHRDMFLVELRRLHRT